MRRIKAVFLITVILCAVPGFAVSARGAQYEFGAERDMSFYPKSEMDALIDSLPDEARRELEEFVRAESDKERAETLRDKTGIKYWVGYVGGLLKTLFVPSVKGGAALLFVVVLSSVVKALMGIGDGGKTEQLTRLVTSLMTAAVTMKMCLACVEAASAYIRNISSAMTAMVPVMGAVMVTGGAVTEASVSSTSLMLYLTVTENLCRLIVIPLCGALLALSAVSGVFTGIRIGGFVSAVRRLLMTVIGFSMLVFSFVLGIQTSLARSADSLAAKTVRFAVGSYIPVVGGAVSEALSTLSASLSLIRSTAGSVGIVLILLCLLPSLLTLLLTRLTLILCRCTAELLDCSEAERIIGDADGIVALYCAMCILSAVFFIFAVVLFMGAGVR